MVTKQPTGQDLICLVCGTDKDIDIDHVVNRGMGGSKARDVPENKTPLCRPHHTAKQNRVLETRVENGVFKWRRAEHGAPWQKVPVEVSQRYKCLVGRFSDDAEAESPVPVRAAGVAPSHARNPSASSLKEESGEDGLVLAGHAAYNETSLVLKEGLSYEEWEAEGHVLSQMTRCIAWWWGDWLNYGERNYGESYSQAINLTGKDYSTVSHWKWVADKVEVWRRRQSLSWEHHREVAKLEPSEQDRWLNIAEQEGLRRTDLRERLKGDGDVLIIPKLYQCPDCGFTAKREGFREVSK